MSEELALRASRRANAFLRRHIYTSAASMWLMFGIRARDFHQIPFWELPTLVLRHHLYRSLRNGMRVLEVGTGPYGVLSVWAAKHFAIEVVATDIHPKVTEAARRCAIENGADVRFVPCDVAEGVDGPFDLAFAVLPYSSRAQHRSSLCEEDHAPDEPRLHDLRNVGGKHGWEITERFYRHASRLLRPGGRTLLSFNHAYQEERRLVELAKEAGLEVRSIRLVPGLPYAVHEMERPA